MPNIDTEVKLWPIFCPLEQRLHMASMEKKIFQDWNDAASLDKPRLHFSPRWKCIEWWKWDGSGRILEVPFGFSPQKPIWPSSSLRRNRSSNSNNKHRNNRRKEVTASPSSSSSCRFSSSLSAVRDGKERIFLRRPVGNGDRRIVQQSFDSEASFDQRIETNVGSRSITNHHWIDLSPTFLSPDAQRQRLVRWSNGFPQGKIFPFYHYNGLLRSHQDNRLRYAAGQANIDDFSYSTPSNNSNRLQPALSSPLSPVDTRSSSSSSREIFAHHGCSANEMGDDWTAMGC